jgi:hypothetical protein
MTRKLLALIVLCGMAITVGGMACGTEVELDKSDETDGAT